MQTARITARQVAESFSVPELREAAQDLRTHPDMYLGDEPQAAEDIAALLEYIADLRDEAENE